MARSIVFGKRNPSMINSNVGRKNGIVNKPVDGSSLALAPTLFVGQSASKNIYFACCGLTLCEALNRKYRWLPYEGPRSRVNKFASENNHLGFPTVEIQSSRSVGCLNSVHFISGVSALFCRKSAKAKLSNEAFTPYRH